ncbi:hypothetical protein [Limnoglobus roseus]|uniref:Uncharacterized protein n=1 Tax=Limnoglobus roseus TaxID=2598579 RepID=A0A5C1A4U2_9BACT|nr:hypothetical protein [Limnoglobus roseus]QEL14121.1 hypothetical protein PX52LOC_00987 [Limnoglobus roseus]
MTSTHEMPPGVPSRPASVRDKCWQRQFVAEHGLFPQPWFVAVVGDRAGSVDLGDLLVARPGSYILKPRFGSNGVAVVRVVSDGTRLSTASDCPDTALFLDEYPADPGRHGRDVVAAVATQRHRFVDRATAGLPEWAMGLSILEGEIRQDRAGGALFEPRIVAQRTDDRFITIGAIGKRVDTPIGAVVARDFRELSLEESLAMFLAPRVPAADLGASVRLAQELVLSAGDRAVAAVAPLMAEHGIRVHQFGVDGRLCWNPAANGVEFWFLEFQFGIGRIDVSPPPEYRSPADLRARFGPESG